VPTFIAPKHMLWNIRYISDNLPPVPFKAAARCGPAICLVQCGRSGAQSSPQRIASKMHRCMRDEAQHNPPARPPQMLARLVNPPLDLHTLFLARLSLCHPSTITGGVGNVDSVSAVSAPQRNTNLLAVDSLYHFALYYLHRPL
jgi:hypothetical protein